MKKLIGVLFIFINICTNGQKGVIELKAENFEFKPGTVEFATYKGKKSMKLAGNSGPVVVKNLNFKDGTIEFDVESILPGFAQSVFFHRKDDKEQEIVYLRVTKIGDALANEAVQYTPYFDGVNMWDMYPQYQAPAPIKKDDWNHMKLVIHGKRMRVYVNDNLKPALEIPELEGNLNEGTIAFEGASHISNLKIMPGQTEGLSPEPAPDLTNHRSNYIRKWGATQPELLEKGREVTNDGIPEEKAFAQTLAAEREGLINLTRKFGMNQERKMIWLRAVIESANEQTNNLDLGFSDEVWVFLNGRLVWVDKNLFQQDTRKYPKGRISIENARIPLYLKTGSNELTIAVANDFYGWGIIARLQSTDNLLEINPFIPAPEMAIENIQLYLGEYESPSLPFTLKISEQNNKLTITPGDQDPFVPAYRGNHIFDYKKSNLKITFNPKEQKVLVEEGNQQYMFTKK